METDDDKILPIPLPIPVVGPGGITVEPHINIDMQDPNDPSIDGFDISITIPLAPKPKPEAARDTSQIPRGMYCYEPLGMSTDEQGSPCMKVRRCPYWKFEELPTGARYSCEYLGVEDPILLGDQVKICGENEDLDER